MPSLQIIVTSTDSTVTIPSDISAKHLHLKAVSVRTSAIVASTTLGVEISVPFLKHYYQINSSTSRTNFVVPLSTDAKTTYYYPDIVYVGEEIAPTFQLKLLKPSTGALWTDGGGATIEYVMMLFEYSVE
jgi:hypothetical protein